MMLCNVVPTLQPQHEVPIQLKVTVIELKINKYQWTLLHTNIHFTTNKAQQNLYM